MYTYTNSFHNTSARSRYSPEQLEDISVRILGHLLSSAEKAMQYRLWKKLCGMSDCTCGDNFGRR